jgi:hypothetical protein
VQAYQSVLWYFRELFGQMLLLALDFDLSEELLRNNLLLLDANELMKLDTLECDLKYYTICQVSPTALLR